MPKPRISSKEIIKIINLRKTGHTLYEIKNLTKRANGTVWKYIKNVQILHQYLAKWKAKKGGSKAKSKREWKEAALNLGASNLQYWLKVAMPVLLPSILGSMILLFGNAFGAYATAYALTGGQLPIVTILIGAQIRGDVLHNPGLGFAMAMGMVVIMAVSLGGYSWLQSRTERWLK